MKEIRPRLNEQEWDLIQEFRNRHKGLSEECEAKGIPIENVKNYWYKSDHFSINVKGQETNFWDVKEKVIDEMKRHAPAYPDIKYRKHTDGHLLVVDPADVHIGKLCSAFENG
jgi:hypothetical protein